MLCPQVEEFSVEPPLDDLSLDEVQFVLAPSCSGLDPTGAGPEAEEESGEDVFLSAYDDLSPLLGAPGGLEDEAAGSRGWEAAGQAEGCPCRAAGEAGEAGEAEAGSSRDVREEAEGSPEREVPAAGTAKDTGGLGGGPDVRASWREGGEDTEASGEEGKGQRGGEAVPESGGELGEDQKERETGREDEAEAAQEALVDPGEDPEPESQESQETQKAQEVQEAPVDTGGDLEPEAQEAPVDAGGDPEPEAQAAAEGCDAGCTQEAAGGGEDEGALRGHRVQGDRGAREGQGDGEDGRSMAAVAGGAGEASKERESGDGEAEGDQGAGGDRLEDGFLLEGSYGASAEVDSAKGGRAQSPGTEQVALQHPRPEEMEPEGRPSPGGCSLCPCPPGSAGGVGMRLASTLVQVQQVRSVPVVPPKPQFAKMPPAMCSKIHVAPANPAPRPGRLDGTPGERAWGARASRASWRNGASLSFDAAVALARDRQRTEAQAVRRTQTCTGGEDYSLLPRTSPCSVIPAPSPRPLSFLELPSEGTEGSGPRSRLSLPPREPQPPHPLMPPQRRTYAFETQANAGGGEGL